MSSVLELYAESLLAGGSGWWLRYRDGRRVALPVQAWTTAHRPSDELLLADCRGPVLDLGCGPGRLTVALLAAGVPALGVDLAPAATRLARDRGALALTRSVFDHLPGTGRWQTALLADGNIGIGGGPTALLERAAALLAPSGRLVVELGAPGTSTGPCQVRLEHQQHSSAWFPWADVSITDIETTASEAGLRVLHRRSSSARCSAVLVA